MEKRGQVTIFVIAGLLILVMVFVSFFLLLKTNEQEGREEVTTTLSLSSTQERVNNLVELCFDEFSDFFIYDLGKHAGYAVIEEDHFRGLPDASGWGIEDHPVFLPLVYLQCGAERRYPMKEDVKRTLEQAIEFRLNSAPCLEDFDTFRDEGWDIEGTEIDVSAQVEETGIFLDLTIPRTFRKNDQSFSIDTFHYDHSVNVLFYLEKSQEIIDRVNELLLSLQLSLGNQVLNGLITEDEAIILAQTQVDSLLDGIENELILGGYVFEHRSSLAPPPECDQNPELFLIKEQNTQFKYVWGASL